MSDWQNVGMFSHVRGAAFFVRSYGSGDPPLVVTGALTAGPEVWHVVTDRLSARRRIVSIDQRGAGRTQADTAAMTLDSLADDLLAVVADVGVERCIHVTESAGCAVGLVAAARQPDVFSGLVLSAPADWLLDPLDDPPRLAGQPHPPREEIEGRLAQSVVTSMPETEDPAIGRWARTLLGDDWEALMRWNEVSLSADLRDVVQRVEVPTLVIHGEADAVSNVEGSERLVERLPRAELVVIEGAGHVPMVTRPDEVEAAIEDFIARQVG